MGAGNRFGTQSLIFRCARMFWESGRIRYSSYDAHLNPIILRIDHATHPCMTQTHLIPFAGGFRAAFAVSCLILTAGSYLSGNYERLGSQKSSVW